MSREHLDIPLKDPPTVEIVRAALVMNVRSLHVLVLRNSMLCAYQMVCNLLLRNSKRGRSQQDTRRGNLL